MKSETDNGIVFLLLGLGLGVVAGLLWAPRRGSEIRGDLRSGAAARWSNLAKDSAHLRMETRRWLDVFKDRFCKINGGASGDHSK